MTHQPVRLAGRAKAVSVRSWQVQSTAVAGDDGAVVSSPAYRADGWYVAPPRSTVMGALLSNGRYPDVCFSTRLSEVDRSLFAVPWWFRTTFSVTGDAYTAIRSDGVIPRADLFVNGAKVAGSDVIAGAYTTNCFEVSDLLRPGQNSAAFLVHPGNPNTDLSIGWVDWNRWPPDDNMGIWRDVWLLGSGPVRLSDLRVSSVLEEDLSSARLEVTARLSNLSGSGTTVRVVAALSLRGGPPGASVNVADDVWLEPSGETVIRLSTAQHPELLLRSPEVWWPIGEGSQPLYDLELTASVDDRLSDAATTGFGVRSVTSHIEPGGGRRFVVNGRPLQVRGAGWCPDLFLRDDPQRRADEVSYAADIGLNTIRLEGKLEQPEFFDLTDETGMMVLPGWECCDKWEAHAGTGGEPWDDHDFEVAERSMASEAFRLANHPSVIGFLIGSDFPPEPRAARAYLRALETAGWDLPIVPSATVEGSEAAGPSGMKMTGPYAWVPPDYWYRRDAELGGAVGFNSEASAGNNIPRLPSLERMMAPGELDELWRVPGAAQFHAGPAGEFESVELFHRALSARYGPPASLRDFARKAQLASYEAVRAQFEAFGSRNADVAPATGVIYWMLNSAWPSLNWQLWDHFLDPGGAYFGAKKANEPVHVQFAYDERAVEIVNRTGADLSGLTVRATVRDIDGSPRWTSGAEVEAVRAGETLAVIDVPEPEAGGPTYFLDLGLLDDSAALVSRNVYWLSTIPDVLALDETNWKYTPVASFADLRGLETLSPPELAVAASVRDEGPGAVVTVEIANRGGAGVPAVGVHVSVLRTGGPTELVAPILWNDNDIVLFAGESMTLAASFGASGSRSAPPAGGELLVEVDAFNLAEPFRVAPTRESQR